MCRQRLARVLLFGCLLTVLGGGAPLLRPRAAQAVGQPFHAQAAQAAPALVWTALPLSSRNHDGDGGDNCSVVTLNCDKVQQECVVPHKVVQVVPVPVVKVVTVEKKVFVPVEKKVFVPVPVPATPEVKVVPVPATPVVKVVVPVPPPVTPTPMPMPPGDPMF